LAPLSQIKIRRARRSDANAITELKTQLDRLHRLPGLWPPEGGRRQHLLRYRKMVHQRLARLFVAEEPSRKIVGYLTAFIRTRKCDRKGFGRVGVIGEVYVQTPYRSQKIGTSLVNAAASFFLSEDVRHLTLRNAIGNELANRFWSRFCFNPILYIRTATLADVCNVLRKPSKRA
jgi:GNAT superfamily N-acetyltransferase